MLSFLYKVTCFYDNDKDERCGVVQARSFQEAVAQIEEYFGDEIENLELQAYDISFFSMDAKHYNLLRAELEEFF